MAGPLDGVRIFDFTLFMVGPWASMQLGALGADVIHIEQPDIDWATLGAGVPPTINGTSIGYIAWNMNKRAFSLDMKDPVYIERARQLVKTCDVFLVNMRPGVADRLGLGYEAVSELNPRIVYVNVTGFGTTGPWVDLPGADTQVQYISGFSAATGKEGSEAEIYRSYTQMDGSTGNYAAQAITMGLLARERTGKGQLIDLSMLRATTALQSARIQEYFQSGKNAERLGHYGAATAPDQALRCEDGEWIAISATSQGEWRALCEVIGRAELTEDARFATNPDRVDHRKELSAILESIFAGRPRDHWMFFLGKAGVPCGYQMKWDVLRNHRQVVENNYIVEVETAGWGPVFSSGPAWQLSETPATWFGTPFPGMNDVEIQMEIEAAEGSNA